MTSHGIRGSTLTSKSNIENEAGLIRGKPRTLTPGVSKGRFLRSRAAMKDIGNKANILPTTKNGQTKGIKKGVVKSTRGLKNATTRLTKKSEKQKPELKEKAENKDAEKDVIMEEVPVENLVSALSTKNLGPIDNVDKDDIENPQLVVEYVNDIYAYLRHLEIVYQIDSNYLKGKKVFGTTIQPQMRAVLVDWLIEVHQQFNLLQETLFLTVAILDRFLQDNAQKVDKNQLQLVGVTAMFIAAKYEEMYSPEIGDFVYITDRAYSETQIRQMEIRILGALGFGLSSPLPLHFLRRYSKAGSVEAIVHTLAKYVMELTLTHYKMVHLKPSFLAAAALALSLKVLDQQNTPIQELWTPTLVHYTTYCFDMIKKPVHDLASLVWETTKSPENTKLTAVRKKYENKKFSRIAKMPELTGPTMQQLKDGITV